MEDKTKRLPKSLHLPSYFQIHACRSSSGMSGASWDRHLSSTGIDVPFLITWQLKSTECASSSFSCPLCSKEAQWNIFKHQSISTQIINAATDTQLCAHIEKVRHNDLNSLFLFKVIHDMILWYTHLTCFVFYLARAVLHQWLEADKDHPLWFLRFSSESSSITQGVGETGPIPTSTSNVPPGNVHPCCQNLLGLFRAHILVQGAPADSCKVQSADK